MDSGAAAPDLLATDLIHLGMDGVRAARSPPQARVDPVALKLTQHVANGLVVAPEHLSDPRHPLATGARQQDLAPTELIQVLRVQPGLQMFPLLFA